MDVERPNVITIEFPIEDDDEPLFDIKKVSILRESKPITIDDQSKVRLTTYKKTCYVPLCPNSSTLTPEKMFITIPVNPFRRKQWLDAAGKEGTKNPKSPLFCCQDHFDLEEDMINYQEHLCKGKVQMLLHKNVVPRIFHCNDYAHLTKKDRIVVLQRLHDEQIRCGTRDCGPLVEEEEESIKNVIKEKPVINKNRRRKKFSRKMVGPVKVKKTILVEMPSFEHEDRTDYVSFKENGIETIIIDDSD